MEQQVQTKTLRTINVGSRNSQLALIQTNLIINQLEQFYENNPDALGNLSAINKDGIKFNVVPMTTSGDQILDKALPDIGTKSLFTKELEVALLEGRVDFVVHSLKDLPTTLPDGCVIGAIAKRDDPDDTIVLKKSLRSCIKPLDLIFKKHKKGEINGQACKIGTSSQRRIAMLRRCNHELECTNIRGNLNTRLAKLDRDDGEYAAIVLARAGLDRMGWSDRASDTLSPTNDARLTDWCYAVGQGAIAVECRSHDNELLDLLEPIVDLKTTYEAVAERNLMRKLEGGCSVPLGVRSSWPDNDLNDITLEAVVLSLDGKNVVKASDRSRLYMDQHETLSQDEMVKMTTGIAISSKAINESVNAKLMACANLGTSVANKMIDSGCLELMGRKK